MPCVLRWTDCESHGAHRCDALLDLPRTRLRPVLIEEDGHLPLRTAVEGLLGTVYHMYLVDIIYDMLCCNMLQFTYHGVWYT